MINLPAIYPPSYLLLKSSKWELFTEIVNRSKPTTEWEAANEMLAPLPMCVIQSLLWDYSPSESAFHEKDQPGCRFKKLEFTAPPSRAAENADQAIIDSNEPNNSQW